MFKPKSLFILGAVLLALGSLYSLKPDPKLATPFAKIPDRFADQGTQPESASIAKLYREHGIKSTE